MYAGLVLATAEETFGRQRGATDLGRNVGPLTRPKKHHHAVTSTSPPKSRLPDDDGVPILRASNSKKKDFLYYAKRVGGDRNKDELFLLSSTSKSPLSSQQSQSPSSMYPLSGSGSTTRTRSTSSVSSRSAGSFSTRTPREVSPQEREMIQYVCFPLFSFVFFCNDGNDYFLQGTLCIRHFFCSMNEMTPVRVCTTDAWYDTVDVHTSAWYPVATCLLPGTEYSVRVYVL